MTTWKITYSKDERTEVFELQSASKPSLEEAVMHLLKMAEQVYEREEPRDLPNEIQTPAVRLAECYGITITGITRD
ncbi:MULTISPECIES: hypothetical protein [unclassified Pseudomonas]|uniref:hypothetical protein n=1 Tax=unclassified Pseudomonas TaxID=196821 RepID=UPI001EE1476C|nr:MULTISPECIES: hypothetical protein [unclassified Pseudomonas]MCG4455031.1 hypothetical protein [Pseudomonas sp. MMS21 TM103]